MDSLSDQNPLVKRIRRAVSRGTLTEDGYAIAEGKHLIKEALRSGCEIRAVIVSGTAGGMLLYEIGDSIRDRSLVPEPRQVSEKTFRSLSSTETPQGVLALVKPPPADRAQIFCGAALVVILDGVQEPGNAGAIVRVAEAFGATGAVFLKGTVDPFHPRCLRGSTGSAFRLPIVAHFDPAHFDLDLDPGPIRTLRIYAAMPRASSSIEIRDADFTGPCAIAIGGEGPGVSEAVATRAVGVHIPTRHVESLNAAVAAGILFYEAARQRDASRSNSRTPGSSNNDARQKASR